MKKFNEKRTTLLLHTATLNLSDAAECHTVLLPYYSFISTNFLQYGSDFMMVLLYLVQSKGSLLFETAYHIAKYIGTIFFNEADHRLNLNQNIRSSSPHVSSHFFKKKTAVKNWTPTHRTKKLSKDFKVIYLLAIFKTKTCFQTIC